MSRYRPADVQPLDMAAVEDRLPDEYQDRRPDVAGYYLGPGEAGHRDERAVIRLWTDGEVDADWLFPQFVRTLCHEFHHDVLQQLVSEEVSWSLDEIAGDGTYLIDGEYDLD